MLRWREPCLAVFPESISKIIYDIDLANIKYEKMD